MGASSTVLSLNTRVGRFNFGLLSSAFASLKEFINLVGDKSLENKIKAGHDYCLSVGLSKKASGDVLIAFSFAPPCCVDHVAAT